jgi:protein-tyrosine phosphatase
MTFAPPPDDVSAAFRICFVCSGNICRSPMAEIVFRQIAHRAGHDRNVTVTSAGTGDWHVGEQADARTLAALTARGYDGSRHRARQFDPDWFGELDLVVALDRSHDRILRTWAQTELDRSKVQLLMGFVPSAVVTDIPDPYYADASMFDEVLATIERACESLFSQLQPALRQGKR